jgi:uncharacterized membrane protein (UPF0127 family)
VDRLRRLPVYDDLPVGIALRDARGFRARLLGLAFLDRLAADEALLIRRCRSVHTFGMRFPIDVVFVDADFRVLRVVRHLPPRRVASCPGAAAVIEVNAGDADRLRAGLSLRRARAAGS